MSKKAATPTDERADRDLLEDPDLIEFTRRLPEARKVSIQVMNPSSGSWKHKGSMLMEAFSLDNVQRRFGGGTYRFSLHNAEGLLLKTISNMEIDDLPEDEREAEPPSTKTTAIAPVSEMALIREQMREDRMLMLKLIEAISTRPQPQPQSDIVQLVTALETMKRMEPKHEQPPQVQDLLMKSFTSGLELAQKIQKAGATGETSPISEILGFARELFQDARPIIQAAIAKASQQQTVQPGSTIAAEAEEMDETEIDLKPALLHVKQHLSGGMPPGTLASFVLQQMQANPELDETLSALIVEQPIESFLELDPDLKEEPLRTLFGKFFGEMRARILQARDSRGDSGNTENAGDHAGPDARLG